MKIVLENMLRRSRNSGIVSMDGIFVSVGNKYWEVNQENRNPRNELEKFLLKILGQNNFNNYYDNIIDEDLKEEVNVLKSKYYDIGRKYNNKRVKFIS